MGRTHRGWVLHAADVHFRITRGGRRVGYAAPGGGERSTAQAAHARAGHGRCALRPRVCHTGARGRSGAASAVDARKVGRDRARRARRERGRRCAGTCHAEPAGTGCRARAGEDAGGRRRLGIGCKTAPVAARGAPSSAGRDAARGSARGDINSRSGSASGAAAQSRFPCSSRRVRRPPAVVSGS